MQYSGAVQRNRRAAELAVRTDHDRLLVAGGVQRDIGIKAGRAGDHLERAIAPASLEIATDVAARLAPGTRKRAAAGHDIAGKIEAIAVAGAGQAQVQPVAAGADRVGGAAADAFGRPVIERDGSTAGPDP